MELSFVLVVKIELQFHPGNLNCQGKLKLLRVIGVSSYRGFEQTTWNTWLKWFYACTCFIVRFLATKKIKQKHENQYYKLEVTAFENV